MSQTRHACTAASRGEVGAPQRLESSEASTGEAQIPVTTTCARRGVDDVWLVLSQTVLVPPRGTYGQTPDHVSPPTQPHTCADPPVFCTQMHMLEYGVPVRS